MPGERAAPRHPVAAGIVDHDQVDPARLLALGGQPRPRPAADDRLAAGHHRPEPLEQRRPLNARHEEPPRLSLNWPTSASANAGSFTLLRQPHQPPPLGLPHRRLQRPEQRRVGLRVEERLPRRVQQRHPAVGDQEPHLALAGVQPLPDPAPDPPALLGSRPHQRDLRVMHIEGPTAIEFRYRLFGAEVDHVQRPARADIGHLGARDRPEPVLRAGQHPAAQEVAHLRRRHVDDARDQARIDQLLHRLPARPRRVEHQAVVLAPQPLDDRGSRTASSPRTW